MSDSTASLLRKIDGAGDLLSVVRSMKALAAASIGQYEKSVLALADYYRTIELGLSACLRENASPFVTASSLKRTEEGPVGAIVFGSDQGLVGQFNDAIADFAVKTLASIPGQPSIWAVGGRVHARLTDAGLAPIGLFAVPNSVAAIAPLVGQIQLESEAHRAKGEYARLYLFHNRPYSGSLFEPVCQRLLPFDPAWQRGMIEVAWPTHIVPEVLGGGVSVLRALIREYLFISLFRACAESLASENASRLSAMERAGKNIDDLLENLRSAYRRLRQNSVDEELFDLISGYEALRTDRL